MQLIQAAIRTHARLFPCLAGDHCEPPYGYLHHHESSHENYGERQKLPINLKQLVRPEHTRQKLIAEVMSFPRISRVHRQWLNALLRCSCCRTTAFDAAKLREGIPSSVTHLFSRRSIAAGPQAPIALRLHLHGHVLGCLGIRGQSLFPRSFGRCPVTGAV